MICQKCGAVNDVDDSFCFNCGTAIDGSAMNDTAARMDQSRSRDEQNISTINARTMIAAKEARTVDIRNMRPLTRMAYNIVESERGSMLSALISMLYGVSALGLIATLIKIFETVSLISQSLVSSNISGSLGELLYGKVASNNTQLLIWLVVLFVALAAAFVMFGKLSIRINKVNRKKRRETLDSRL